MSDCACVVIWQQWMFWLWLGLHRESLLVNRFNLLLSVFSLDLFSLRQIWNVSRLAFNNPTLPYNSPMHSVSELGMQDRISTSMSEHWVQVLQGLVLIRSSEKVPGAQIWHCVSPCGPHSLVTPSPARVHLEQGAHRPCWLKKKWPMRHLHCVSWVPEQEACVGIPDGHFAQGMQGLRPSDEKNIPGKQITKSVSVWVNWFSLTNISGND